MPIKKIHIQNFKSLVDFELDNPKPFCAFVGPNASGKSNIFEALEFVNYVVRFKYEAANFFGGMESIFSYNPILTDQGFNNLKNIQTYNILFEHPLFINFSLGYSPKDSGGDGGVGVIASYGNTENIYNLYNFLPAKEKNKKSNIFIDNFSRIFIDKSNLVKVPSESKKLKPDGSNTSQIIGQIFQNENKREDFIEWLRILIPEFKNIEVKQSNIDGSFEFFVYEKSSPNKPFPRHLLSDGTKNILALMAAVYQSNEPQFLCIEEPENGLHPQAIELLVDFFREKCETEGHHIWLNTHSQTLVRCMEIDEIILVNKEDGRTTAKQAFAPNGINIKTDDAWLTNALGGGVL
jgi:predicted ATPase